METTQKFKFANGDNVREIITGFEGTITGSAFYITGCNCYLVVPKIGEDKSKGVEGSWYDEGRLSLVKDGVIKEEDVEAVANGCDRMPDIGTKGH